MLDEQHPREDQSIPEADDPRHHNADAPGPEHSPRREIIPGNVGSLDDVPADLMEEANVVDDEESDNHITGQAQE